MRDFSLSLKSFMLLWAINFVFFIAVYMKHLIPIDLRTHIRTCVHNHIVGYKCHFNKVESGNIYFFFLQANKRTILCLPKNRNLCSFLHLTKTCEFNHLFRWLEIGARCTDMFNIIYMSTNYFELHFCHFLNRKKPTFVTFSKLALTFTAKSLLSFGTKVLRRSLDIRYHEFMNCNFCKQVQKLNASLLTKEQ